MDNQFHLEFPFTKVDRERRVVVGVATADNIDKEDDIVDFDASLTAFKNWVGNIREMHAPKAVGKALAYRPVDIVSEDGTIVRGVEVEAYVSKGAEDTWQKVLDETLKGFSIGGNVEDQKPEFHTKLNKMVRRITKYSLGELSLVDNPCNPMATISVVKNHNGTLTYELEDSEVEKAETYTPPSGVRAEARRALDWIKNGEAGGGFTDVGRRRASQLANGDSVSLDTIKRMASYLARHKVDKQGEGWSPGQKGYPSPGRVAWAAWGGDPAIAWTNKVLRSANALNKVAMAELEYVEAMLEIVDKYGKLADNDGNGIWVDYEPPEENDDIDIGVKCENCYFYEGDGVCAIVARTVDPNGYCRLAAIPSRAIDISQDVEEDAMDESMMMKSSDYEIFFCKDCGIATHSEDTCSSCKKEMVAIGTTSTFDKNNISKIIDSFMKGGVNMEDLQKNENYATMTTMDHTHTTTDVNDHTHSISMNLVKEIASAMVPQFNFFTSNGTDTVIKATEVSDEAVAEEVIEKSEDSDEAVEGGEEVNTEELLKGLSAMMDEKLNEFKTEITATVDEKIDSVAKSVEVSEADADTDSLEKSDEVEVDDKDALIKSLSERLERLESKGAVKKSLDVDDDSDDEVITKNTESLWGGMFIPTEIVNALGYES